MKIILFDIDGTLMLSGGAGLRAMEGVFFDFFGIRDAFTGFKFQGKVDTAIFREAIHRHKIELPDADAVIRRLIPEYEKRIAVEMPRSDKAVVFPGVRELLAALDGHPGVSLGLLTGNVYGGARAKLAHFDLWRHFPYGAFGCDNELRTALLPVALQRAAAHLGTPIAPGPDVYVIGDTDRDVEVARVNGCTAVGVGTLEFTAAQLAELGAPIVFDDFSDTARVLRELGV